MNNFFLLRSFMSRSSFVRPSCGMIDAVASEDSDCFVLGFLNMIQLLDISVSPTGLNCTIVSGNSLTECIKKVLYDATFR